MTHADERPAVRVLVADDQRLMRTGIASLLEIQEGIEIVGMAADGREAVEQAVSLRPDVILMDVRMPIMDGVVAAGQIRRQLPECQVLMLTTFDDEEYVLEALRAGACGYLLKDIPAHDLARAILAAHQGIYQLDPAVASKVVNALKAKGELHVQAAAIEALTQREIEVLRLIAKGATNREIAEELVISEGTVKNHISNILSSLELRDRTQAAIFAKENGLL
ncbi:MAG TPA: response regulator transcription factor [Aggregatilineales bacterium]|nr:response regulator transcription factor [Aggregatilineales bacterium]